MVTQRHGLGPLQVCVAGQIGVAHLLDSTHKCHLESLDEIDHVKQCLLRPEPERSGHLIIPATSGVQLAADDRLQLGDSSLNRRVNVLVG